MPVRFVFSFLPLIAMMPQLAIAADNRDRFEARTFTDGEFKLPYRLLKPKSYDRAAKYPLVIFLHGAGERGDDNLKQLVHGMNDFASEDVMTKYPAFVMAPQCPEGMRWSEVDWSSKSSTLPDTISPALAATLKAADSLQKEFSIDPKRIYVTGLSMGSYGVWDAMSRQPQRFAAAAIICGGGDPAYAIKMKDIPVWLFHGDEDRTVPVGRSREMIDALKAAGANPKYTEYPGVGHNSWARTYADPALYDWFFAQQKL